MEEKTTQIELPDLNCGLCGFKSCEQFKKYLEENPDEIKRCIHLQKNKCNFSKKEMPKNEKKEFKDFFGREFDFILDSFENEPGPNEIIHPFNPQIINDLDLKIGNIIIGRPMSAGCPVTHCGKIMKIDKKSCLINWCIVGPLEARKNPLIDIGNYSIIGFNGIIKDSKVDLKIGMRHHFMPRRCMIQWRHSGLITAITNTEKGKIVRIEGIFLG